MLKCCKILSKEGWNVETAENGNEGIEKIKANGYDVLLLDLMMPGISGLEVIGEVNKFNKDIYIIIITGYATVETAVDNPCRQPFNC